MFVALIAALALVPQTGTPEAGGDTPVAIRSLVESAGRRNRERRPNRVRASLETEIAVVSHRASGRREILSVQQEASTLEWTRDESAEQRITGYRAGQVGMQYAMTRAYRAGWVLPLLQGERLQLRLPDPESVSSVEKALEPVVRPLKRLVAEPETVSTVHPLARDGLTYYQYPRADSLREAMPNGDSVDVVRIAVTPREDLPTGTSVFVGDLDVDARTLLVVRLRGRIFIVQGFRLRVLDLVADQERVVGFVDMWNGPERDGWRLPEVQRLDIVTGGVAGESATLVRFVTRFREQQVIDPTPPPADGAPRGTPRYRMTYAPRDSQAAYDGWLLPIGRASTIAQSQPVNDLYPDRMQPSGPSRWSFRTRNSYEVFRFNKVEGLYTGLSAAWLARDRLPGLSVAGTAGYAWSEETWRGYVGAGLRRKWIVNVAAARLLDPTNDFRSPLDSTSVWSAVFWSSDNYDYVDRHVGRVAVEKPLTPSGTHIRFEVGAARDEETIQARRRGIFFGPFRPNRVVDPGSYIRTIGLVEWNPDVHTDLTRERFGGGVRYERGDGDLDYRRAEAVLIARHELAPVVLIGRLWGGVAGGTVPTQQLFEIGSTQNLPGYDYKAFAGDRAWIARATAQYAIPTLRAPFPLIAGFVVPAIAPELNLGVQTGMAWASDDQARDAVRRLGDKVDDETGEVVIDPETGQPVPTSVPTEKLRATASLGLRLLSGAMYVGVALPIDATRDTRRGLRLVIGFGRQL